MRRNSLLVSWRRLSITWGLPIEPSELADFVAGYVERNHVLYDELEREIW